MVGTECDSCGTSNAAGSRFCRECGLPLTGNTSPIFNAPRYTALRWQIDPMDPPPRRDRRWMMIVLGGALLVVGVFLLGTAAIVGAALSVGAPNCGPGPSCYSLSPGVWFEWASVPFLLVGGSLLALGAWRAIVRPSR